MDAIELRHRRKYRAEVKEMSEPELEEEKERLEGRINGDGGYILPVERRLCRDRLDIVKAQISIIS